MRRTAGDALKIKIPTRAVEQMMAGHFKKKKVADGWVLQNDVIVTRQRRQDATQTM
jgi:hypothetical protein